MQKNWMGNLGRELRDKYDNKEAEESPPFKNTI